MNTGRALAWACVVQSLYRMEVGGELWPTPLRCSLLHLYLGGRHAGRLARLGALAVGQLLAHLPRLTSLGSYPSTADALVKVHILLKYHDSTLKQLIAVA